MPTLDFKGKNHIYAHHLTVPYRPLQLDESRSVLPASQNGDVPLTDQNLIIHGDNLHALKALLPHYAGRVKRIYIDPPYNTGNQKWTYNDRVNSPLMRGWFDSNSPVDSEDLERHEKWLCMMWPRLHLLRELMSESGVIFISIDDHEAHHLRLLLDETFGAKNYLATMTWRGMHTKRNSSKDFSKNTEYILAFAKDKDQLITSDIDTRLRFMGVDKTSDYRNDDNDGKGLYKLDPLHARNFYTPYFHTFRNGVHWEAPSGNYPRYSQDTLDQMELDGEIQFGIGDPKAKRYLSRVQPGVPPDTLIPSELVAFSKDGSSHLNEIMGEKVFDQPKPWELIAYLLSIERQVDKNERNESIVMDSFAGSGTTAEAILRLNCEDGGSRRFIMVECEDYADNITAERVRRVIRGVPNATDKQLKEGLGGSFAYCTLGEAIDIDSLLQGDSLPSFSDLASYLLHTATGISASPGRLDASDADGHFYSSDAKDYYLIYEPSLEFLRDGVAALNLERAERIREKGRPAVVFAAATYISQSVLSKWHVTFCQLPYELGFGG